MKRLLPVLLLACLGTTSCVLYLDCPPRGAIRGRVLQPNGQPLTNAVVEVRASRRHMTFFTEQPANLAGSTVTDSNGTFAVSGRLKYPVAVSAQAALLSARAVVAAASTNALILQAKAPRGLKLH